MNTRKAISGLVCAAAVIVAVLSLLKDPARRDAGPPVASQEEQGQERPIRPTKSSKREESNLVSDEVLESVPEKQTESSAAQSERLGKSPDEELLDRLSSLELPMGRLEAIREVEKRIKKGEVDRSKLIRSGDVSGGELYAYAIKQPSKDEVKDALRPLEMLRDRQTDVKDKEYVDLKINDLVSQYGLTEGRYRLVYVVAPEEYGGAIQYYSYAVSSEEEAVSMLDSDLAPKDQKIGVSSKGRAGSSGRFLILPSQWRLDHLISNDQIKNVRRIKTLAP